jgi:hypothetical protein
MKIYAQPASLRTIKTHLCARSLVGIKIGCRRYIFPLRSRADMDVGRTLKLLLLFRGSASVRARRALAPLEDNSEKETSTESQTKQREALYLNELLVNFSLGDAFVLRVGMSTIVLNCLFFNL